MFNYFEDYGYDSCTSRGVCSISTRMASIFEVIILYLREFANYALKLEQFGISDENCKNLILNTLSAFVSNPEIPDNVFATIICTFTKELDILKQKYKDACEERALTPEMIDSELLNNPTCDVISSIRLGEQKYLDKLGVENKYFRSTQELLFFSAKSIAIYLIELNSYGEDFERGYLSILELLDILNIKHLTTDDIKAVLYNAAEEEFALIKQLSRIKSSTFGIPSATEVSLSTQAGKAILVDGSNLKELVQILEASKNSKIDIYTHGKMISAHLYPKLREYSNLKGHFGQGAGNSILDFSTFPGAVFVGRHSIDNIDNLYRGRIFTTDIIVPKGVVKIENSNFEPLIEAAKETKGFKHGKKLAPKFLNYELKALKDEFKSINFEKYEGVCIITQGNDYYEDKNYFEKLLKLMPDDILVINFSTNYEGNNIININAGYELNAVFEIISILKENVDILDKPIIAFIPRCDKHITNLILNLKRLGIKKVFMGKCPAKNINPIVVNEFKSLFDITSYGSVKEDYKLFLDSLTL